MKKSTKLTIGIVLVVAIICVVAVIVFADASKEKNEYDNHLTASQRYLDELDYENAIAELENAIEIEPNNAKAYMALSEIYEKLEEYENAVLVLEQAQEKAENSAEVANALSEIQQKKEQVLKDEVAEQVVEDIRVYLEHYVAKEPFGIYPFDGGGNAQYGIVDNVGNLTWEEIVSYLPAEIEGVDASGVHYPMTVSWSEYDVYNPNEVGTYALYGTVSPKENILGNIPDIIAVVTLTSDVATFGGYYKIVEEDVTLFYSRIRAEDLIINVKQGEDLTEKLSEFESKLVAHDGISEYYTGITSIEWNVVGSTAEIGNFEVTGRVNGARQDIVYPDITVMVSVQ